MKPLPVGLVLASMLFASCGQAQQKALSPVQSPPPIAAAPPVVLDNLPDGVYVLSVQGGVVTVRPAIVIVIGPQPNPTPTPTPTPSPLSPRAEAIKAAAAKVADAQTAPALAELYRQMAKLGREQIKDEPTFRAALAMATDTLLKTPEKKAQWQPVRDLMGTYWTTLQAPPSASIADYAKLLDEAATGLDASAPLKGISPEMLALITQIIQLIIALFLHK